MERSGPAQLYCLLVGGALVIAGIAGFFYEASFASGDEIGGDKVSEVLGILAVNGWHNLVHLTIGGLLLVAAGGAARGGALLAGGLYLLLATLGFIATGGEGIGSVAEHGVLVDLVPVNSEDNVLHLVLGITGVAAAISAREGGAPAEPEAPAVPNAPGAPEAPAAP
jgi:hypothetical protein